MKVLEFIKKYFLYIVGGVAFVVVGIITISTANKLNTSKILKGIKEYFFLRSKKAKRKGDTIKTEVGDVDIPEDLQDTVVTGIGHTEETTNSGDSGDSQDTNYLQSGSGTINHEITDRKNVTPIENSFKKMKK